MSCNVYAVIQKKINREIIKEIIDKGTSIGFKYEEAVGKNADMYFTILPASDVVEKFCSKLLNPDGSPYAGISGWKTVEGYECVVSFYLGFDLSKDAYFPLQENEFLIRFGSLTSRKHREFRNNEEMSDLGWYVQALLDVTGNLPIKLLDMLLQ